MPPQLATLSSDGLALDIRFHPGQWRAWNSNARFVAVTAGTQSGKTSFGPYWLLREMALRGPGDALVVTPTFPLLELKLLPEFRALFERKLRLGTYTAGTRRCFTFSPAGMRRLYRNRWEPHLEPSRVLFGYAAEPDSLESATTFCAWCDEAGQKKFRYGAWEAILRRLSLAQGRVLITTSLYQLGWLKMQYDRWLGGDRDWQFISFDSTENPLFPVPEFERARRQMPYWKFNMFYRGRYERPAGLIYDAFNPEFNKCPRFAIPPAWPRLLGLDFGDVNLAAVFLAREPDTAKFYLYRTYHAGRRSVPAHVRALLHGEPGLPLVRGGAPGEDDWRTDFARAGLPVHRPAIHDVELGLNRVYSAIQGQELVVFDDLEEFNDEITTYSRVLDSNGEPTTEIEDKHAYHLLDSLRYALSGEGEPIESGVRGGFMIRFPDPLIEMDRHPF